MPVRSGRLPLLPVGQELMWDFPILCQTEQINTYSVKIDVDKEEKSNSPLVDNK